MVKTCLPFSSISYFAFCFFVNTLVSLPIPHPDQIEILVAFKNEFPVPKCHTGKWAYSKPTLKSWMTNKDVNSFDGVTFDNKTGLVTELDLTGACLGGTLSTNSSLFKFHHLRSLDLSSNYFDSFSFLTELGKLTNLEILDLSDMGLVGKIPSSISNLSRLTYLSLSSNDLTGSFSPLYNLSKLTSLFLSKNHFSGNIPCSLLTMPSLSQLDLSQNHFSDSSKTINCSSSSKLEQLDIHYNLFSGQILEPLSKLSNLKHLELSFQKTTSPSNFVSSGFFKSLEFLDLSGNSISELSLNSPNLDTLFLYNCSINKFPEFLKKQEKLSILYISYNRLEGEVPEWVWRIPSLGSLLLSHNSLDSFEGSSKKLLSSSLDALDLSSNAFRGSLPIISPRLKFMLASNNSFSGDIPLSLCNQSYLGVLDLSHNSFSGSIPRCLSKSVEDLNLRNNKLIGSLPDIFEKHGSLRTLDVGNNQITGKLPRSLAKCRILEVLNVESNRITDTFPFWLKDLPNVKVIVLRSNKFSGPVYSPQHPLSFPQLQIIDISRNKFTGSLPLDYFVNWRTLRDLITPEEEIETLYMGENYSYEFYPSIYMRDKGVNTEFEKIYEKFTAIDFSGNRFEGQIPESIGLLKSLMVLDLSNNNFKGHIPLSLANLTQLESLDLSQNQLSGKIPQELTALTFLSYVNMSHNKLTGQIPQSSQIGGQTKSCFEDNIDLCGLPLQESCFKENGAPPQTQETEQEQVLNWKAAMIGYAPGVLFGVAIAQALATYKPLLFFKLFRL